MTITPTPAHALATTNGTSRQCLEADMSQQIRCECAGLPPDAPR